jgi:hypothetical protein
MVDQVPVQIGICRAVGDEEVDIGRVKAFAGVSGIDEDVGLRWYGKPPIHPMGIEESKDCMPFEWNCHSINML